MDETSNVHPLTPLRWRLKDVHASRSLGPPTCNVETLDGSGPDAVQNQQFREVFRKIGQTAVAGIDQGPRRRPADADIVEDGTAIGHGHTLFVGQFVRRDGTVGDPRPVRPPAVCRRCPTDDVSGHVSV